MAVEKNKNKAPFAKAIDFEVSLSQKIRKSERIAWIVASLSLLVTIILACGYLLVMPLKEKVPYIVMADPYVGTSTVSKIIGADSIEEITKNEAIAKSNVAHFVYARESYDYDLIGRRDWVTVNSMAGPDVKKAYKSLYGANNPDNPNTIYGPRASLRVKIKSIVLNNISADQPIYRTATVRFDKILVNKEIDKIESITSSTALIQFEYNTNLSMAEDLRVENPLSFVVTGYRVDPELTSSKVNILKEIGAQASGLTSDR